MTSTPAEVIRAVARNSKRVAVSVVGGVVVLGGLAMLVLPGPGILVVMIGFAILGIEYTWAARALERTKRTADRAGRTARGGVSSASQSATGAIRSVRRRIGHR